MKGVTSPYSAGMLLRQLGGVSICGPADRNYTQAVPRQGLELFT